MISKKKIIFMSVSPHFQFLSEQETCCQLSLLNFIFEYYWITNVEKILTTDLEVTRYLDI